MGVLVKLLAVSGVAVASPLSVSPNVHGAATRTVALYKMNEPPGSTVLVDSSGNGLHGSIGSEVLEGTWVDGVRTHRFQYIAPNTAPARPGHLDTVPSNSTLNPDSSEFAVTVRAKWTHSFGNMIQKGQAGRPGGYFKMEAPGGYVRCLFLDSNNVGRAVQSSISLKDGRWHTIRCERLATGVTLTVDGIVHGRKAGIIGVIANEMPLSIGGKSYCNGTTITCDYWVGYMDWVRVEKG